MDGIVYSSNTGYTKKYAQMLEKATGIIAYSISSDRVALKPKADVIYMGWLKAGSVVDLGKAQKRYNVIAVCPVGMAPPDNNGQIDALREKYEKLGLRLFYLRGGYCHRRLRGINRIMMDGMIMFMKNKAKKADASPADKAMVKNLVNGCDYVSEENLNEILEWLNKEKIN